MLILQCLLVLSSTYSLLTQIAYIPWSSRIPYIWWCWSPHRTGTLVSPRIRWSQWVHTWEQQDWTAEKRASKGTLPPPCPLILLLSNQYGPGWKIHHKERIEHLDDTLFFFTCVCVYYIVSWLTCVSAPDARWCWVWAWLLISIYASTGHELLLSSICD